MSHAKYRNQLASQKRFRKVQFFRYLCAASLVIIFLPEKYRHAKQGSWEERELRAFKALFENSFVLFGKKLDSMITHDFESSRLHIR